MKAPSHHFFNQHPDLQGAIYHNGQAYHMHRRRRKKQHRSALLLMVVCLLVGLISGLLYWAMVNYVPGLKKGQDTAQIEAILERDFGSSAIGSLLYYPSFVSQPGRLKLMPIMPQQEDQILKQSLESLIHSFPAGHFTPHLYYYNPEDGSYVNIDGYQPVPAASVIKLPVLLAYLMSLDTNTLTPETPLLFSEYHRASGAGELQYKDVGQTLPAGAVAKDMIRISDNTCTNMLIDALGGQERVNQTLRAMGMGMTRLNNWLPDLEGTNQMSSYEMVTLLYNIDQGPIISDLSRFYGLQILEHTHNRRLLPALLPDDVRVFHKTGDIGTALGDSGLFYYQGSHKYLLSIQVERPYNDYTAREMIQQASRIIYERNLQKLQSESADSVAQAF